MEYEQLLEDAYEKVEPVEESGRFEIVKVKGHHEGTRTIISNFGAVVGCCRRNSGHLIKFLNKELASSSELRGERLIFSRKLASKDVNEKIERYVSRFVLCPKCKKPDTELNEEGAGLYLRCLACGEKREVHRI